MISRRDFLARISAAMVATSAVRPLLAWSATEAVSVPGKDGMILRSFRFLDLEMPTEYCNSWLTPVSHFFVRNHMHEPSTLDPEEWRLRISGQVERPFTLSLAELGKFESHDVTNTLECAGNGRDFQKPQVPGVQWQRGAVGTARFAGPRLRDVLMRAGVRETGKHVMFRGLDEVPGKVPLFIRSIPIEKAMDEETLIATRMNGAALTKHHGFPARALVPGWIGAASCKWLTEIKVLESEFVGNFMSPGYRFPNQVVKPGESVKPEDTHVVTGLNVKSVISGPIDGSTLRLGKVTVHGAAWAGEADIVKVEISTDGGSTWNPAKLGHEQSRYAWRLWAYTWNAKGGDYVLQSRATDSHGRVQPTEAVWNPSGYHYNAIDQVKIIA